MECEFHEGRLDSGNVTEGDAACASALELPEAAHGVLGAGEFGVTQQPASSRVVDVLHFEGVGGVDGDFGGFKGVGIQVYEVELLFELQRCPAVIAREDHAVLRAARCGGLGTGSGVVQYPLFLGFGPVHEEELGPQGLGGQSDPPTAVP